MAGETTMTITGNLTAEPDLRYTPTGQAVAAFTVASTPRYPDKQSGEWRDGDTLFLRCNVWRDQAENVCNSVTKGTRVIVTGRLKRRSYEKDGQKRTAYELEADDVAVSLKNASAKVTKSSRSSGGSSGSSGSAGRAAEDPWAGDSGTGPVTDEPPF